MENVIRQIKERLSVLWQDTRYLKELLAEVRNAGSVMEMLTRGGRFGAKLYEFFTRVAATVELCVRDLKAETGTLATSEEKLQAAAEWLDQQIALPWWAEWADGYLIKVALSFAVQGLNDRHGHQWPIDQLRPAVKETGK